MNSRKVIFVAALVAVALLSSCRSSRHAVRTPDVTTGASQVVTTDTPTESAKGKETDKSSMKSAETEKETTKGSRKKSSVQQRTSAQSLTSKLNLTLSSGSKKLNVAGTYRMKRNEVIQINITYTLLVTVNIGTLELTPDYILVLDRFHKRYCRVGYSEVPALVQNGIDFAYLQRIFWGEAEDSPSKAITWKYADWMSFADGQFPANIQFELKHSSSNYKANFDLSNLRESADWDSPTEVSSKYTAVSFDTVMRMIMSMAQ